MTEYLVTKRESCGNCKGSGMVQHRQWTSFFEVFPSWPEPEAEMRFWQEKGWIKGRPDEEITCHCCKGRGVIESEMGLIEALTELHVILSFNY